MQRQTAGRKGSVGPRGAGEGGPAKVKGQPPLIWSGGRSLDSPLGMGAVPSAPGGSCLLLNVKPDHVLVFLPRTLRELLWKNGTST